MFQTILGYVDENDEGLDPLRIFQLLASHGNIGKSGMCFAFKDNTANYAY